MQGIEAENAGTAGTAENPAKSRALEVAFGDHWGGSFEPVGVDEHTLAREVFSRLIEDIHDPAIDDRLEQLALASRWFDTGSGTVRLVHEKDEARRGRGVFAFRHSDSLTIFQAPHTRNDPWTGKLTGQWTATLNVRAAAWNTVSRRAAHNADLARATRSYFVALADAAIDALSQPSVIQIHGFNNERRSSDAGRRSNAILSSGSEHPARETQRIVRSLSGKLDDVMLYPFNVLELGATGNPVGRRMRQRDAGAFTHIELSRPLRNHLRKNQAFAQWVGSCLIAP